MLVAVTPVLAVDVGDGSVFLVEDERVGTASRAFLGAGRMLADDSARGSTVEVADNGASSASAGAGCSDDVRAGGCGMADVLGSVAVGSWVSTALLDH